MAYYDKYGVEYFDERCTQLMRCPKDFSGHYVIPKTVRWITRNAFEDCSDLESVDIPDSVEDIGERAFHNCKKLWYIIIPAHTYVREEAFHGCLISRVFIFMAFLI